ncbi:MAG: UDP-N-acetylmuramoyl-L-alanine--D-glutamate ligase [Chloroflexi bacterium HGW-Chloroflexi-3]|nr:MAG: UDP-N-acetylmuramoyl-L-alanine--D-glutamate ligase [Chloroflexi bacterium HGW-Chloroflexi-3]
MKSDWMNKQVLVIGAARQGLALARFLASHGAVVTLNDGRLEQDLQSSKDQLKNLPIRWVLGEHPLELLRRTDLVCVSGGVPLDIPLIVKAVNLNIPLSNDSQVFMENVPCPVIGITGSAGKTTTTTLLGDIAYKAFAKVRKVWVGGNIGNPLINHVKEMTSDDLVILELSSFQLELMTISPNIAAIMNITPNHLDRHGTLEAYTSAKANILKHQTSNDYAILNRDDRGSFGLRQLVKGKLVSFGFSPIREDHNGSYIENDAVWVTNQGISEEICKLNEITLPGKHNISNVLAASAISMVAGLSQEAIRAAILEFKGVPHRLQFVREWNGIRWINDSKATTPEGSMAAIEAFSDPIVLLLGGKDKNLPWNNLLKLVNRKVDHIILFGNAAEKIHGYIKAMKFQNQKFTLDICNHLQDAVITASKIAEPGDIVLLSPGGTSYDEFKDFEERGEKFQSWVQQLQ